MKTTNWHKPLLWFAASMVVLALVATVGAIVDPRELLGANLWFKPLKFAISIAIYAVTLSWLIGMVSRFRKLANVAGWLITAGLVAEIVIIVGAAYLGQTSHFNMTTPLNSTLWSVMGSSIAVVWMMTFAIAFALFRNPLGDPARTVAIRVGAVLAIVGMGLAFLMTSPTAQQLASFEGIAGAHAVGIDDGGPGLPFFGWSTVAGDLRIPHFVGMHALQFFPLLAVGLEFAARRVRPLADVRVRVRVLWVAAVSFLATIALLTVQALSAQSIVRPEGFVLVSGVMIAIATVAGLSAVIVAPLRPLQEAQDRVVAPEPAQIS